MIAIPGHRQNTARTTDKLARNQERHSALTSVETRRATICRMKSNDCIHFKYIVFFTKTRKNNCIVITLTKVHFTHKTCKLWNVCLRYRHAFLKKDCSILKKTKSPRRPVIKFRVYSTMLPYAFGIP